jgi:FtsP/CotA-like multicopper oxidase with cupredoxin domain
LDEKRNYPHALEAVTNADEARIASSALDSGRGGRQGVPVELQQVVIRQRFAQFTGEFVYHCHILAHEDNGMMAVIKISGPKAGVADRHSIHRDHMAH